jgi:hypothetical protein
MGNKLIEIPEHALTRLNSQQNRIRRDCLFREGNNAPRYRLYSVGLGEKHLSSFLKEINRLCSLFTWAGRSGVADVTRCIISSAQSSMLREVARAVQNKEQIAAFMPVTIFISERTFFICVEEFAEFFNLYGYISRLSSHHYKGGFYSEMDHRLITLSNFIHEMPNIVLSRKGKIITGGHLSADMRLLDGLLSETVFSGKGRKLWRRIFYRIDAQPSI